MEVRFAYKISWDKWRFIYDFDLNGGIIKELRAKCRDLTLRRLMSYIYGAPILDVSRSHTTTQHSR